MPAFDKKQVDAMVNRFLGWRLPQTFGPDCYISFDRERAKANQSWPIGTNLLTFDEARQMLEYVLAALAGEPAVAADEGLLARMEKLGNFEVVCRYTQGIPYFAVHAGGKVLAKGHTSLRAALAASQDEEKQG